MKALRPSALFWQFLTGVLLLVPLPRLPAAEGDGIAFFEKHVRPVLIQHCYECHSLKGGKNKGNLLLDSREGWLRGGDSGPAIVPGDPAASLLVQAIRYADDVAWKCPRKESCRRKRSASWRRGW